MSICTVLGAYVPTGALRTTGIVLERAGNVAGVIGLGITYYQYKSHQITGMEASVDAAFGVIGLVGPVGAGVPALTYPCLFLTFRCPCCRRRTGSKAI